MKKLFSVATCIIVALNLHAQEQPNLLSSGKITTIGYWNIGDKAKYHVIKSETTTKASSTQPTKQSSETFDLEITVMDSTEHSYILEMKYLNGSNGNQEIQEIMNSLQTSTVIRYQTDEFGSYEKILNIAELQKNFNLVFNELKNKMSAKLSPEKMKEFTAMLEALRVQFSKPENIEVLYLQDILGMHAYYGIELNLNKPQEVDLEFPCFGNIIVPGTGKLVLQSINKAKDIAAFSMTSKPNKEELKKYMQVFIGQLFTDSKEKIPMDQMSIDFENKEKFVIHLSDGWMESIETSQTVFVSDSKEKIKKVTSKQFTRN